MNNDEIREELLAGLDRAKHLCLDHGITTVQQIHADPACPCTVQYRDPEDVQMIIGFTCPRHGDGAQQLHQTLEQQEGTP